MNFAEQLALFSKYAEEKGLVNSIEGNLSVIDRATGNIYITPSHKMKALLTPEQICVIDPDGNQIAGTERRSSEFFLHEAAYKARPDIGAVVHCHVPYLTAYALAYRDFETPKDTFLSTFFGNIKCLPYGEHGTHGIHAGIEDALSDGRPVALLGGHGVVCVSDDIETAIGWTVAAENYAKTIAIRNKLL